MECSESSSETCKPSCALEILDGIDDEITDQFSMEQSSEQLEQLPSEHSHKSSSQGAASSAAADETNAEESTALMLYEGSSLTTESSLLLLNSYVCHHNITQQACQDLLQLLRLHLPKENALPSSLYLFQKQSELIGSQHTDIVPNYCHYCPKCYTLITDSITLCPNECCEAEINFDLSPYFITVSIADQLKSLFARKLP